jgi:hypothetical protein
MHSKVTRRTFLAVAGAAAVARRGAGQPNSQQLAAEGRAL